MKNSLFYYTFTIPTCSSAISAHIQSVSAISVVDGKVTKEIKEI